MTYRGAQNLIKRGDEAGLREALEHGLDANLVNQNGWTLLMLAAVEGAVPLGRCCWSTEPIPALQNNKSETARMLASHRGFGLFADLLSE
jgi:ankyrin repeat protein